MREQGSKEEGHRSCPLLDPLSVASRLLTFLPRPVCEAPPVRKVKMRRTGTVKIAGICVQRMSVLAIRGD